MSPTHPSMVGVVAVTNLLDGPPPVFDVDVEAIATCSGCGCALPPHAVYCVECGRCELSQTDQGTRIVRSPYAPKATRSLDAVAGVVEIREANVRTLSRPARRWAPTGIARLDTDPRKDTVVTRAPAAPAPFWDAPPKGNTVKRRAPKPST